MRHLKYLQSTTEEEDAAQQALGPIRRYPKQKRGVVVTQPPQREAGAQLPNFSSRRRILGGSFLRGCLESLEGGKLGLISGASTVAIVYCYLGGGAKRLGCPPNVAGLVRQDNVQQAIL